jgi:hypothetical protein
LPKNIRLYTVKNTTLSTEYLKLLKYYQFQLKQGF